MEKRSVDEHRAPKDNAEILLMAPGKAVVFHAQVSKLNHSHDSLPTFIYTPTSCVWLNYARGFDTKDISGMAYSDVSCLQTLTSYFF